MSPTEWFAWGQILFGALACIPFLAQDWRNRSWIARYPMPSCPPASAGELPQMTIIVCVLDEAEAIEGKDGFCTSAKGLSQSVPTPSTWPISWSATSI